MFKRTRTYGRKATKTFETKAHAARVYKKVVRQWELALNIKCQIVHATPGSECPNGGKIVLVSNAELQGAAAYGANANFPDAMRIKRLEGNLYFRPDYTPPGFTGVQDCYATNAANQYTSYMRMGLRKAQGPQSQAGVPDALNPLNNGATPSEVSDYVDGRWMKLWEHVWDPAARVGGTASNDFSCCSVQAGYTLPSWTTTLGTGAWAGVQVPPIVCEPCGDPEDPATNLACTFEYQIPRWWHCRVRHGRPIVLKENDDLSLYFGWEKLMQVTDNVRPTQPNMEFFGGIRMLLES